MCFMLFDLGSLLLQNSFSVSLLLLLKNARALRKLVFFCYISDCLQFSVLNDERLYLEYMPINRHFLGIVVTKYTS